MKNYIGCKLIKAAPMTLGEYNKHRGWQIPENEDPNKEGYLVLYSDDYCSWSPKAVFEKAYLEVEDNKDLPSGVSIGPKMVKGFIREMVVDKIGDKTTMVRVVLLNGYEIIETSGCVDPSNFDQTIGTKICMKKIEDKIWAYLGFMLQTAWKGVKR